MVRDEILTNKERLRERKMMNEPRDRTGKSLLPSADHHFPVLNYWNSEILVLFLGNYKFKKFSSHETLTKSFFL